MKEIKNVEDRLDNTLERLGNLIDKVAESEDPDDLDRAIVAASQLARIQERVAEARRGLEPKEPQEPPTTSTEQMLETLRSLVRQHSYLLD